MINVRRFDHEEAKKDKMKDVFVDCGTIKLMQSLPSPYALSLAWLLHEASSDITNHEMVNHHPGGDTYVSIRLY